MFILDFKPSSKKAETEMKCNTGIWENLELAFYIYRQLLLSPS